MFHGPDELGAVVGILLNTDAFVATEAIRKVNVDGVKVHGVSPVFGAVDLVALISTKNDTGGLQRIYQWVAQVRDGVGTKAYVRGTNTSIVVPRST